MGKATSEDLGEGLNVGLVGGRREGTLGGQGEGWEGEDLTKGKTTDKLFSKAKSGKKISVLLVRKFFSRDQIIGRSVYGGRGVN